MSNRNKPSLKTIQLDNEEQAIVDAYDIDALPSVADADYQKRLAKKAATNYLRKDARINIRLSSVDLLRIKEIAAAEGLPYQTLIASILHKYAAGNF